MVITIARAAARSLLDTVIEYGADGGTALPPVTLSYQDQEGPDYELSAVLNNPTSGDHLFNMRHHFAQLFDSNEYVLYPHYSGSSNQGIFSNGDVVDWSRIYTQTRYPDDSYRDWTQDSAGNLIYLGVRDTAFYGWTYLFCLDGKSVSLQGETDVGYIFLNGDYANPYRLPITLPLRAGYNLLELTGYNQNDFSRFNLTSALANQVDLMNSSQVVVPQLSGDFNGDGLADVGTFFQSTGEVKVALSNGTSFLPKQTWISGWGTGRQLLLGDFNADGRTDILAYDSAAGDWFVATSDGQRFVDQGQWMDNWGAGRRPFALDINADGRTDILNLFVEGGDYKSRVALNNNGSFVDAAFDLRFSEALTDNTAPVAGDFNGDGVVDVGGFETASGTWQIHLCSGNLGQQCDEVVYTIPDFGANFNMVVADINSDGRTDIGYYDYRQGRVMYRLATGDGFSSTTQSLPFSSQLTLAGVQVQNSDFNGDGLTDFIIYNELGNVETLFSTGEGTDLLAALNNGLGGRTRLDYGTSVAYENTYLPFALPVVTSMTVENGLGDSYTTRYAYKKGVWDVADREFFGFGEVRITDPQDNYRVTEFRQDDVYLRGRPAVESLFDNEHHLVQVSRNTWAVQDINTAVSPAVRFPYLVRTDQEVRDINGAGRRTAQEFYYEESPQLGNLTRTVQLGEVDLATGADIGEDRRTVETQYTHNTAGDRWLIGLPAVTTVRDHDGAVVRRSWYYYDGHSDPQTTPWPGLLTKKVDWAGDGPDDVDPETRYGYDAYGNLSTTTDARGNSTTISYDPDYHLFPLVTTNALGQRVVNRYYGINGVALDDGTYHGLWGQLRQTIDPNDQTGTRIYDALGRVTSSIGPLDSVAFPSSITEYAIAPPYVRVTSRQRVRHGEPATIDAVQISDALGRVVQTKTRAAQSGQYVLSGQTQYNSRGLPERQYLPRFVSPGLDVVDPIDVQLPHTLTEYDAAGRVVRTTNPDGSFATAEYHNWTVSAIDETGTGRTRSWTPTAG